MHSWSQLESPPGPMFSSEKGSFKLPKGSDGPADEKKRQEAAIFSKKRKRSAFLLQGESRGKDSTLPGQFGMSKRRGRGYKG